MDGLFSELKLVAFNGKRDSIPAAEAECGDSPF
jgi:hypothetical protein